MTYAEKLTDPRWQKKRLEILERDGWKCVACGDHKKTLHVHHGYYERGLDPWDYSSDTLWTLCVDCHDEAGSRSRDIYLELARLHPSVNAAKVLVPTLNTWRECGDDPAEQKEMDDRHLIEIVVGVIGAALRSGVSMDEVDAITGRELYSQVDLSDSGVYVRNLRRAIKDATTKVHL